MDSDIHVIQCIGCPTGCSGEVIVAGGSVVEMRGFTCDKGKAYAAEEVVAPKRMVTTTIRVRGGVLPLLPVASERPVPKGRVVDCVNALRRETVDAPIAIGAVVLADALGLGIRFRAARAIAAAEKDGRLP
jgi:CxxC motif-containing protein